jgi:chaperonin GroEL
MKTQVLRYKDIRDKILQAVDLISEPIRGTMSPKGNNVLFRNDMLGVESSNDGHRLAKMIQSNDQVVDLILDVIKNGSTRTNTEAGDATSTTILLSSILIKEGLKLVDEGWKPMDIKKELVKFREIILKNLKKESVKIMGDKDILNVAAISANNDYDIAKDILQTVKVAGLDGMVFLEGNNRPVTDIIEDTGFNVGSGMFSAEFRNNPRQFSAMHKNVPVLITDKRIYYKEEAETIIRVAAMNGHKNLVVIARDFIGEAVNVFRANHDEKFQILLVKDNNCTDKDNESLKDLAAYTSGKLISEKNGSLVNKLKIDDYIVVDQVFSDATKTLISTKLSANKTCRDRVKAIKSELKKDKEDKVLNRRLASLTNGMVTLKIGGATPIEMGEKIYRYEDAINATRAAMRDGTLVGGGVALRNSFKPKQHNQELLSMFKKYCEANMRQIASNCGEDPNEIIGLVSENKQKNSGYNALTGEIEDLAEAGVLDAYKAVEMAVTNSVSVANEIISSNFLIVPDVSEEKDNNKK